MFTFMAKVGELDCKWYVLDAAGKPVGRIATKAAAVLRGKHRPQYTPHIDCGEHVIIINAASAILTGKKLFQKEYIRHSGYVGGLKRIPYKKLMAERPAKVFELAIWGMLPHNALGRKMFRKLKVCANSEHDNMAQKPVLWNGDFACLQV